jgi:hypothetical protein
MFQCGRSFFGRSICLQPNHRNAASIESLYLAGIDRCIEMDGVVRSKILLHAALIVVREGTHHAGGKIGYRLGVVAWKIDVQPRRASVFKLKFHQRHAPSAPAPSSSGSALIGDA